MFFDAAGTFFAVAEMASGSERHGERRAAAMASHRCGEPRGTRGVADGDGGQSQRYAADEEDDDRVHLELV